jgi:hypothetical protein
MTEQKKSNIKFYISIVAVLFCMIASVAYLVLKLSKARAYDEKWQDYDECGI